ncbi:hypothetical protein BV210_00860 [Halorientalis sp. IM1011]|uniref:DUF998 domain-containing protein n=1 Tax=Halorientalis sp. IM1011 TaxID=1932360 RepID=UPI00097CCC5F|nr:DUF998 domain-containing protein [Halorientalis sp. IM1011]AQL41352.1 hypothetical protein BV210_00860 [Halorientalis sp. IM1011]
MTNTVERASVWAGLLAPILSFGGLLLATLVSPAFTWTGHALSELGAPTGPVATDLTRLLFNGGLIAGGLVALGFGYALFLAARNLVELAGIALFGLTSISMAGIGVFPMPQAAHFVVAVSFYVLLSLALWVYGTGNLLAGERTRGGTTIGLGVLNAGAWAVWGLTGEFSRPGLAVPEIVGAAALAGWIVATAFSVRRRLAGD